MRGVAEHPDLLFAGQLLASELAGNAVRHAGPTTDESILLVVACDGETLRLEVVDEGLGFDPLGILVRHERNNEPYHGIVLVNALSDRWGFRRADGGMCVWFELDLVPGRRRWRGRDAVRVLPWDARALPRTSARRRQTEAVAMRRVVLAGFVLLGLYVRFLRRRILTWGATDTEAQGRLPGDELLEDANGVATRAIEIAAPRSAVWPWLAQLGPSPRGGAYTYDWIENLLGLDMHSVDRVLPEFQSPRVGDSIELGSNRMRLERVEPERVLAWRSEDGNWVWTFVLEGGEGSTRLISRNRYRLPTLTARAGMLPLEPASLVMERRMLLGIKERAERLAARPG
jgi:hypothetical protein